MGALTQNEEWRVGGWGLFSQILSDESLFYSLKHISTGEHSLHISRRSTGISYIYISCFHDDVIKWKHVLRHWLLCGNSPMTAGNSPVTGEFPSHRPVTRSFDVFFDLRLNKGLSKQSRHRWFETPSLSLWRHCNMGVVGVGGGGSVHYGRNGLKFGTLLYIDYHSLKLTTFCTQRQFKFESDHLWINFELGRK